MDLTFRYNTEIDDVELVVGDEVVDTIGKDVVESWVTAYNNKHGFVSRVEIEQENKETEESEAKTEDSSEDKVDDSAKE